MPVEEVCGLVALVLVALCAAIVLLNRTGNGENS